MIRPLILSGGGGTRLWPLSRGANPKQFHRLIGNCSLLEATAIRCSGEQFHPPVISTGEEQSFFVVDQLGSVGIDPAAILLEPVARNTAPAIAAAAFWALSRGEDDPLLVMPSDHRIDDSSAFHASIDAALAAALEGKLLTFGIRPTQAHTGYGYIQAVENAADSPVRKVERFVEKPDAARAVEFVEDGSYYWNSGIFLFRPSAFVRELRLYAPNVVQAVETAISGAAYDGAFVRPEAHAFESSPSISIDYAVMEQSTQVFVVPASFSWSDIGSWDAVHDLSPADEQGNVVEGDVLALDVTHSLIRNDRDLTLAVVGLDNVLCIVADDGALIAPMNRAQEAKRVVEALRARGHRRADGSDTVHRPWGSTRVIDRSDRSLTRRIVVKPGATLPLQSDARASRHWIVVSGAAEATIGGEVRRLQENESTFIAAGTQHRLANPGEAPLQMVEVEFGSDFANADGKQAAPL